MKYKDKISVVIPTYNRAYCIKESVNSVLSQSYDNIEIIIVDDGSTDNTKDVIKQISSKLVKYYSYKKNKGSSYARNYGIKKASGKYIAFQDSDDIFKNDKLEKQYNNLIKNKSDLDFCKIEVNLENGNKIYYPNEKQEKSIINKGVNYELCNGNFISTQAILIKSDIVKNNLFDEKTPPIEDYDLVLSLCSKYKISYTDEVLVSLYRQKNSISNSLAQRKEAIKRMAYKKYDFNEEDYKRLINVFNTWYNEDVNTDHYNLINNLNVTINKLNEEINAKEEIINHLNANINDLNNNLKEKDIIINNLNKEINDINNKYNQVINSRGWRYLEKLRKFKIKK